MLNDQKRNKLAVDDGGKVFALTILLTIALSFIIALIENANESVKIFLDSADGFWIMAVLSQIAILSAGVFYAFGKKISLVHATGMQNKIKPLQILLLIVLAFAFICFMLPVQTAIENFLINSGVKEPTISNMQVNNFGQFMLAMLIVVVMPAFSEELIYRGYICNCLSRPGKKLDWAAVVISAGFFFIMHGNVYQTVHQFVIGVVAAVVYLSTRSLWASVALHFANNFFAVLIEYVSAGGGFANFIVGNWFWVMPVSLLVILPILYLFIKDAKSVDLEVTEEMISDRKTQIKKSIPFFAAALIVCVFLWITSIVG